MLKEPTSTAIEVVVPSLEPHNFNTILYLKLLPAGPAIKD